ncbi:metallopeptidase family protein [Brucella sp. BE17]|uniref:metallopeptidase family protein n=1 Tax=Brucella sp. BE17 TaxID=3142977 RepID=UPI0031BA72E0
MAREDQSGGWAARLSPSLDEIESIAIEALAHLPQEFRQLCGDIIIQISDFPDEQIVEDMGLDTPFDLLGLFEGHGIGERFSMQTGDGPNRITLFRRAVIDYWAEHEETLGDIITHVLIHEIGHHFGLSDEDMEELEAQAE